MLIALLVILIVALVLYIVYLAISKFVQGTPLHIIGLILAICLLIFAMRQLGFLVV